MQMLNMGLLQKVTMKKYLYLLLILSALPFDVFAQTSTQVVGKVEHFENFKSNYVRPRNVTVWLPADYNKKEKYAVLYMQDGNENLFEIIDKTRNQELRLDETITELVKAKKIRKCIVVAIANTGSFRHSEYYPQKSLQYLPIEKRENIIDKLLAKNPQADNYLLFLTKELKPFIDKTYSTYKDQQNTFVGGYSMGGLISIYAISEYPKIFGGAACLSTHFMGATSSKDILDGVVPNSIKEYFKLNLPSPKDHKIYFGYGNKGFPESFYKGFQTPIDTLMKEKGYTSDNWITKEFDGDEHARSSWAKQLPIILEFLLKK